MVLVDAPLRAVIKYNSFFSLKGRSALWDSRFLARTRSSESELVPIHWRC